MSTRRFDRLPAAVASVLVVAGAAFVTPAVHTVQSDDGRARPVRDWTTVGGDWTNARHSALTQINKQTVNRLGAAWVSKRFENGASSRSTPVVKDGLMFMTAGVRVYALNAKTGDVVWTWRPEMGETRVTNVDSTGGLIQALNAGIGFPNPSGVAVGEGLVFVGLMNGEIAALSQRSGELRWRQQIGDDPPKKGQSVSAAPVYAHGTLFAGLANGDWALRGRVVALDAKTGRQLWRFFTIPGPGDAGHETWSHDNDVWKLGGGGVWLTGALDEEVGLVYFVTGNAVPQEGGGIRAGNNLYTASIIALHAKTGKLAWHYQVVHHDLWDADIAVPLVLYDTQVAGRARKALGAMRADGYLFLLDRETGKPLFPVEERPVPQDASLKSAATQPFPVGADMLVPDCFAYRDKVPAGFELGCQFAPPSRTKPNILATGFSVRVTPMSYSPQTGYFYGQGTSSLGLRRRITDDPWFWQGGSGGAALLGLPATGIFAAIDSRTNKIVWKKEMPPAALGGSGPLTTAGGLIFRGSPDGNVEAYDASTGDRLWQFQTGARGGRGPAATYEVDGEQHVALTVGPEVWAFKLGGTVSPRPSADVTVAGLGPGGPIEDVADIETASLVQTNVLTAGHRYAVDQYAFKPLRARVSPQVRVTFTNNGTLPHTIVARDGSWSIARLTPGEQGSIAFDKPGTYMYTCKEHPWSVGQIVVAAPVASTTQPGTPGAQDGRSQLQRGKAAYDNACSACHGADLSGRDPNPALAGGEFLARWQGRTVGDLFDKVLTSMPPDAPGSRADREYLEIVAYVLGSSDLNIARQPLTENLAALRTLAIR